MAVRANQGLSRDSKTLQMELVANSLGIGMVYVGYFVALVAQSPRLRQWIGLQETDRVVTCLSMGYPAVRYLRSVPRKPLQARWR